MAILEKEAWVGIGGNNVTHYENLGYKIPRYIDKQGRVGFKRGIKILVKYEDIPKGSAIMIRFICDYCNGKNQIKEKDKFRKYNVLLNGRKRLNKDCCNVCLINKRAETRKGRPVSKGKSLGEKFPHLIIEWSKKNKKTPFDFTYATDQVVWWKCPNCNSEYDMSISHRTNSKANCPYCSGHRVNHTNCLWTTHPEIAKLLTDPKIGYEITSGLSRKVSFTCPECNHSEPKRIQDVVNQGFSCPRCSDGISYPEKFVFNMLLQLNVSVERQKTFEWSKTIFDDNQKLCGLKRYDFYLPEIDCIIETHGEQHYYTENRTFRRELNEEQENDLIKEKIARQNNITHYIVIDCSVSDCDFIKNNVTNSKINKLLCLNNVNWDDCHFYAISSLVKTACLLWEKYKSTKDIAKELHLNLSTTRKYLKQGSKIDLCDYDGQKELRKVIDKNSEKNSEIKSVKVVQLEDEGSFVKEWKSITFAQKELNINNVIAVCRGKQKTAGGYRWMYKSEYENLIVEKGEVKFEVKPKIIQLTLDGQFIKEHRNIGEALKSVGKNSKFHSCIKNCCVDNSKTAYGYKWMYKVDYEN